ncbi:MAG: hypothetical protein HYU74_00125 [Dechloromonas sp.]|nr:hypothetical protein [Dechloromonas sp.]
MHNDDNRKTQTPQGGANSLGKSENRATAVNQMQVMKNEADRLSMDELSTYLDGVTVPCRMPGTWAHVCITPGKRLFTVYMKSKRLKPGCKRKQILTVHSKRKDIEHLAAALAWARSEAVRLGWG